MEVHRRLCEMKSQSEEAKIKLSLQLTNDERLFNRSLSREDWLKQTEELRILEIAIEKSKNIIDRLTI